MAIWVLHISLSQTPLACEALGSWNIYLSWISLWFQLSLAPLIYLSATMKLVLLSEQIQLGGPPSIHESPKNVNEAI